MPKAEINKNLAVAASSILARYVFLKEFDRLSDELHIPLPKGAGKEVDKIGEEIVEKYGEEKIKTRCQIKFLKYPKNIKDTNFLVSFFIVKR